MSARAFSEFRDVIVTFNTAEGQDIVDQTPQVAMSIDAYKAAINKVQEIEFQYAQDPTSLSDMAAVNIVFTGTSRYKLYSFNLTTDISEGTYVFDYVETVPNAESLS